MLRILSLGAGVQSTTVLLMSIKGLLPKLDHAIFADTGWEPKEVYEHLERLKEFAYRHDMPVHVLNGRNLRSEELAHTVKMQGRRGLHIPAAIQNADGSSGQAVRSCTNIFKIEPIEKFIRREIFGLRPRQTAPREPRIEMWFGISVDEAQRMKTSQEPWKVHQYPLCGHPHEYLPRPYSRADCLEWLKVNWPYPVPRSACLGCPFHSDAEWRRIKANPDYWADVTEFDKAIRHSGGMRGEVFLHRSLKPLDEVDFSTAEDHGQLNLFNNECQGMCGV